MDAVWPLGYWNSMLGFSCVGVFNSGLFIASPVAFSLRAWCSSIQTSRNHKLAYCLENEVSIPCSQEPVMGFYSVPHESSPHIIMIYFNIILLSVSRSLNDSFNAVYTKYISDSEEYQTQYHYMYTRELSCRKGTSCSIVAVLYVYARAWAVSYSHYESKLHSSMDNTAAALRVGPARDSRLRTIWWTDSCKKADNLRALC